MEILSTQFGIPYHIKIEKAENIKKIIDLQYVQDGAPFATNVNEVLNNRILNIDWQETAGGTPTVQQNFILDVDWLLDAGAVLINKDLIVGIDFVNMLYRYLSGGDDWILQLIRSSSNSVEYLINTIKNSAVNYEFLKVLYSSFAINEDWISKVSRSTGTGVESLLINKLNRTASLESLINVLSSHVLNIEWGQTQQVFLITRSLTLDLDWRSVVLFNLSEVSDFIQKSNKSSTQGIDWIGKVSTTINNPIERLKLLYNNYQDPLNILKGISTNYILNVDWDSAVTYFPAIQTYKLAVDYLTTINKINQTDLDNTSSVMKATSVSPNWLAMLRNSITEDVDYIMLGINTTGKVDLETLISTASVRRFGIDNLKVVQQESSSDINFEQLIRGSLGTNIDWLSYANILKNYKVSIVNLEDVLTSQEITPDLLIGLVQSLKLNLDYDGAVYVLGGASEIWVLSRRGVNWVIEGRERDWILTSRGLQWIINQ